MWQLKRLNSEDRPIVVCDSSECISIGRAKNCFITCAALHISRYHSEIRRIGHTLYLRDLGSSNGTYLNDKIIVSREDFVLEEGDIIGIGSPADTSNFKNDENLEVFAFEVCKVSLLETKAIEEGKVVSPDVANKIGELVITSNSNNIETLSKSQTPCNAENKFPVTPSSDLCHRKGNGYFMENGVIVIEDDEESYNSQNNQGSECHSVYESNEAVKCDSNKIDSESSDDQWTKLTHSFKTTVNAVAERLSQNEGSVAKSILTETNFKNDKTNSLFAHTLNLTKNNGNVVLGKRNWDSVIEIDSDEPASKVRNVSGMCCPSLPDCLIQLQRIPSEDSHPIHPTISQETLPITNKNQILAKNQVIDLGSDQNKGVKKVRKERLRNIAESSKRNLSIVKIKPKRNVCAKITSESRSTLMALDMDPKTTDKNLKLEVNQIKEMCRKGKRNIVKKLPRKVSMVENVLTKGNGRVSPFKEKHSDETFRADTSMPVRNEISNHLVEKQSNKVAGRVNKEVHFGNQISSHLAVSVYETIDVICSWNPIWIEEQKYAKELPPLYNKQIFPVVSNFKSIVEYVQVLKPLMYLELWRKICKNSETKKLEPKRGELQGVLRSVSPWGSDKSKLAIMTVLLRKETDLQPTEGELLWVETQVTSCTDDGHERKTAHLAASFGYVVNARPMTFSTDFTISGNESQNSLKIEMLVKRRENYKLGTNLKVHAIMYLKSELRLFQSVSNLSHTNLCNLIIHNKFESCFLDEDEGLVTNRRLNASQKKAVLQAASVCRSKQPGICLIQGPPGSGKSEVIISIVQQILYSRKNSAIKSTEDEPKILLCAPSNAAIDELVERLLDLRQSLPRERRFKMVRVGRIGAMRPKVRHVSLDTFKKRELKSANSGNEIMESVDLELKCCQAELHSQKLSVETARLRNQSTVSRQRKIELLEEKIEVLKKCCGEALVNKKEQDLRERKIQRAVLEGADIVASTVNSCFTSIMEEIFGPETTGCVPKSRFTCCIMDEATQCTEPESLIPSLLGINKFVLLGDQEQLPATVISLEAKRLGYGQSLFTRLSNIDIFSSQMHFLNIQYRMHKEIIAWPNKTFYSDRIECDKVTQEKLESLLHPYLVISLTFNQNSPENCSNTLEAKFVAKLSVCIVKKMAYRKFKVAVITPYAVQKAEINRVLGDYGECYRNNISVNTIDAFQGQETDVVIVSCGRTEGVGFLIDSERLNVALTRARFSLVMCGNFRSLTSDRIWSDFIKDAKQRNVYKTISGFDVPNDEEML